MPILNIEVGNINDFRDFVTHVAGIVERFINFFGNWKLFGVHVYTIVIFGVLVSLVAQILYGDY